MAVLRAIEDCQEKEVCCRMGNHKLNYHPLVYIINF